MSTSTTPAPRRTRSSGVASLTSSSRSTSNTSTRKRRRAEQVTTPAPDESEQEQEQETEQETEQEAEQVEQEEQEQEEQSQADIEDESFTPAPSRSHSSITPARISRLEEKNELQDLNKRLEYYILRQKERDASQGGLEREIIILRQTHIRETNEMKSTYEQQMNVLRKQRTEQTNTVQILEQENQRAIKRIRDLESQLVALEKHTQGQAKVIDELRVDVTVAKQRLNEAEKDTSKLGEDLDAQREEVDRLTADLEEAREKAEIATEQAQIANSKAANAKQDYELLEAKTSQQLKQQRETIDELTKSSQNMEDRLRKEFGTQLKQILADRQLQYEEEKAEGLRELKDFYEEKIGEYLQTITVATHESEIANKKYQDTIRELEKERRINGNATALRQALELQVAQLQDTVSELRDTHTTEIQQFNDVIRHHRDIIKNKDIEFQNLMDLKVALDMEIKQYRVLLEQEEDRLGYEAPIKPRRGSTVGADD